MPGAGEWMINWDSSSWPYGQEHVGNLKLPIRVDQLKEPVVFRYSFV
jgi:hypothetical protein